MVVAVLVVSIAGAGAVATGVLAAEEPDNDSRETATDMAANSTETGTLGSDNVDWYAFDVSAGEQINAELDLGSDDTTLPVNRSAEFALYGPSGEEVSVYPNDGMGAAYRPNPGSPATAWGGLVAEQSGTYYARVTGENISDYNLTVETRRLDRHDPNEQPSSATQIEANDTVSAVMSGSDVDTYAIDLDKGETINASAQTDSTGLVNIQLVSPETPDITYAGYSDEYDVAGGYAANKQITYTANESGTYFVRVYPFENGIGSFGQKAPYSLTVTSDRADSDEESTNDGGSGTDDGTTGTPDEEVTSDEDNGSTGNDATETPNTTDTEQSDSGGSVDDADDGASTDTQADDTEQTSQSGPGFTGGGAVIGLLVTALFALRRR